jgi:phospholipid/cholesterol/gamma-HCH transport system substrate-binding protein
MMRRANTFLVVAITSVAAVSACTPIDVNALPAPGSSFANGYPMVMEFANVLNLPARAKVTLDGNVVGTVTGVTVERNHVDVSSRIDAAVSIPSDVHAGLQQDTVLGDIYVALDRPPASGTPGAAPLKPGSRIPLAQSTSPPQLEDTIANLANLVGSGSIQRIQNTIIGVNRITPSQPDIRRMASQFSADIIDLSNNIDTVDHLLDGVSQTGQELHNRIPDLQILMSPKGVTGWDNVIGSLQYVSISYPSVGTIYSGGFWLQPLLESLANAVSAMKKSKWAFESEVHKWRRLFTDYFLPLDKNPAINITSIVGPDGRELSGNVQDVLRILGAMPS